MKIGLVRHFKVNRGMPKEFLLTPDGLMQWMDEYDASEVTPNEVDLLGIDWTYCYASDLSRAVQTAEAIFPGPIDTRAALREMRPISPITKNLKIPFLLWPLVLKLAWWCNHKSQVAQKQDIPRRVNAVLDDVLATDHENILIVSHGGIMRFLQQELTRRGFRGKMVKNPENGIVYLYER